MPIPYDKLTYNDILHHQGAYECFDKAGKELFPDWAKKATSYKKIGSKCLAIRFNNGTSRVFLFENPNNWHFGTKLWRKRPDEAEKKKEIKERNNGGEKDTPIQP